MATGNLSHSFIKANALITKRYDYFEVARPDTVTRIYTFKKGGSTGATVGTVTIVYFDATREEIVSVTKT